MYNSNPRHRAIVITEGSTVVFRYDNNNENTQNIETDIVRALIKLKADGRIDIDKFVMILKASEKKFGLADVMELVLDYASGEGKYKNIHGEKPSKVKDTSFSKEQLKAMINTKPVSTNEDISKLVN